MRARVTLAYNASVDHWFVLLTLGAHTVIIDSWVQSPVVCLFNEGWFQWDKTRLRPADFLLLTVDVLEPSARPFAVWFALAKLLRKTVKPSVRKFKGQPVSRIWNVESNFDSRSKTWLGKPIQSVGEVIPVQLPDVDDLHGVQPLI